MNFPRCGAALGGADLQNPNCRYCGAVHPHMARAAEKVEVVKQMLAPGPGGMPVAMAAMMGMTGPAPQGGAPMAHGQVMVVNGVVVHAGQPPPQYGGPAGYGAPYAPYAMQAVARRGSSIAVWVGLATMLIVFLAAGIVMAVMLR